MSDETPPARGGKWQPGQSGNPKGRPPIVRDIRDLCKAHTREAVEKIITLMRDKSAQPQTQLAAAQELLNRGWGKPVSNDLEDGGAQLVIKIMRFAEAASDIKIVEHNGEVH